MSKYHYSVTTKLPAITIVLFENGKRKVECHTREKSMPKARHEFNKTLRRLGIDYAI